MNLLRVNEVAERLNVTPQTVYRLTQSNKLPHIRLGGTILFNEDTLNDYLHKLENVTKGGELNVQWRNAKGTH